MRPKNGIESVHLINKSFTSRTKDCFFFASMAEGDSRPWYPILQKPWVKLFLYKTKDKILTKFSLLIAHLFVIFIGCTFFVVKRKWTLKSSASLKSSKDSWSLRAWGPWSGQFSLFCNHWHFVSLDKICAFNNKTTQRLNRFPNYDKREISKNREKMRLKISPRNGQKCNIFSV